MLQVALEAGQYICDELAELAVRLSNVSDMLCTSIILRLALPGELGVRGSSAIEINRLPAGQTATHTLQICPRKAGQWAIVSPNFSYRDQLGRTYRVNDLRLEVLVQPASVRPVAARPPAARLAPQLLAALRQERDDKRALINNYGRRLQKLREQQSLHGSHTLPGVLLEIEDIEKIIKRLEAEVARLEVRLAQ